MKKLKLGEKAFALDGILELENLLERLSLRLLCAKSGCQKKSHEISIARNEIFCVCELLMLTQRNILKVAETGRY